jgi:hypothetical protein
VPQTSEYMVPKHHTMKTYGEMRHYSMPYGGEWSASRPARFTLKKRTPRRYPTDRMFVEPRAGVNIPLPGIESQWLGLRYHNFLDVTAKRILANAGNCAP